MIIPCSCTLCLPVTVVVAILKERAAKVRVGRAEETGVLGGGLNVDEEVAGDITDFEANVNLNVGGQCRGDDEDVIFEIRDAEREREEEKVPFRLRVQDD